MNLKITHLQKGEGIRMKKNLSKKQLGVVGLAVIMAVQTPVMAAEVEGSQEATTQTSETAEPVGTEETVSEPVSVEETTEATEEAAEESTVWSEVTEPETVSEAAVSKTEESATQTDADEEETKSPEYTQSVDDQIAVQAANGWQLDAAGNYTYVQNGQIVKNCIMQIDGAYYGFDENGIMYAGKSFQYNYRNYRAKASGSLYISEWYQDRSGNWHYYDQTGDEVRYKEMTINGKIYYFSWNGLAVNEVYVLNGNYYITNQNGERVTTVGWYQQNGNWYVVRDDDSLCTGFLFDGDYVYWLNPAMVVNTTFEASYDGGEKMIYSADASGHVTGCVEKEGFWGAPEGGPTYYIRDGKTVNEKWVNVNEKWYYFGPLGLMVRNDAVRIDGKYYYFYSDGSLAVNGWAYDQYGEWHYAYASGELAVGDVTLGGTEYHFSETGTLQTGAVKTENGYTLYGDDGEVFGTISSEGWNLVDGNYYYLKDGSLIKQTDYQTPDGAWYGFDYWGKMKKNEFDYNYDHWYGNSGQAYTGWFLKGGTWYYADPQTAKVATGFQTINGTEYYFDGYAGAMLVGEKVVDGKVITTDASGKVLSKDIAADGWSCHDGAYYYYKNGKPYTGWVGAYYINEGRMVRDTSILDADGGEYWVDTYGVYQKNTWVNDGNSYAKADGILAKNEWVTIGGKSYYFDDIDKKTESFCKDGCLYVLDADGAYVRTVELNAGWNLVDGEYYYKAGNRLPVGRTEIDGSKYYFVDGKMQTNFVTKDGLFDHYLDFCYGADGRGITGPGWISLNENWYYLNGQSQYVKGWAVIDGKKYYFATGTEYANENDVWGTVRFSECGIMVTGYRVIDNKMYYFDQSGACQGVCGPKEGWFYVNGSWYFMRGGKISTGITTVNGVDYIFDADGTMYTDEVVQCNYSYYYVNSDGAVVGKQGWILTSKGYVYVKADGTACTGVQVINGVTYYFGSDGIWIS